MDRPLSSHALIQEIINDTVDMLKDVKIIKILKMDISNETTLRHPLPGGILLNLKREICQYVPPRTMELHAVEYDQKRVEMARQMQLPYFVKITVGDIRYLPYKDKYFDLIIDSSTLDHIPWEDVEQTLRGYSRVLKDGGLLPLFCWSADTLKVAGKTPHIYRFNNQYWFPVKELREKFQKYFNIIEEEKGHIYSSHGTNTFMYRFLGGKKVA